ncbi:Homeodomain-interacting protein kinase 1 [Channa argus]|uniref:Homeodomain-interacting protein kinase 1 n=1 Tax=Channa argus TaxID=215402 RepID=A0A6G1QQF4_CHAAH|nr:Homeodomain-interacting protein kinase 1 [Channa argus]
MLWTSSDSGAAAVFVVTLKPPEFLVDQTLFGSSSEYFCCCQYLIGEGCFGKVAKCENLAKKETAAVKILIEDTAIVLRTEKEVSKLKTISVLNPDHVNMMKFYEQFDQMGQTCLVFEMLDKSLYGHLEEQNWKRLCLNKIRPIAKQLLVALDALKGLGTLHTDIKPDYIMFVNVQVQPHRVKLINFGEAIPPSKIWLGMELQVTGYKAPEVALAPPVTEAMDVWAVGCILAFLYLHENLFSVDCDYPMMPEYFAANNVTPEQRNSFTELPSSFDDPANFYPAGEADEFKDTGAFVHFIKQLLHLDWGPRISPHQSLLDPFVTMSHLIDDPDSRANLTIFQTMMSFCPVEGSANTINTSPSSADGLYSQGLVSGSTATVSHGSNPTTCPSDRVLIATYWDEDPDASSSDGDQPKVTAKEDKDVPSLTELTARGPLPFSHEQDPAASSFDSGLPSSSCEEDPAAASSDKTHPPDLTSTAPASFVSSRTLLKRIQRILIHITIFCCCWHPPIDD